MNGIKIIKRIDRKSAYAPTQPTKKVSAAAINRGAANVVANWIDELRSLKTTDARSAFKDLFPSTSTAG